MFITLFSDNEGRMWEEPGLLFLGRSGVSWCEASNDLILLPKGSSLIMMPGHYPVGFNHQKGCAQMLERHVIAKNPVAMAGLLPQGFTRTLLPATAAPADTPEIPILGYAALAGKEGQIFVAAVQTDEHRKWHPRFYNTPGLEARIEKKLSRYPKNRILKQLAYCSLHYSCYTAQNIFYERWEGGIPTTPQCNARCLGCISRSHTGVSSPQQRLNFIPEIEEITEIGLFHLERAREGIISFGQGCEGEPALNAGLLASAIKQMRQSTNRGSINLNTNGGYTQGIKKMVKAGLDSMRVTLLSGVPLDYTVYHKPANYRLENVFESIRFAVDQGVLVSLNLLTIPGYTDCEEQLEALLNLIHKTRLQMVQLRNLNIDPEVFFNMFNPNSKVLGIGTLINYLQEAGVRVASYTHPARRGQGLINNGAGS